LIDAADNVCNHVPSGVQKLESIPIFRLDNRVHFGERVSVVGGNQFLGGNDAAMSVEETAPICGHARLECASGTSLT
jgi:hypothetical protein